MTRETDIAVNDPNLDTVKQRKVSDIKKNRLKLIQNTPNCILSVFIKIIFRIQIQRNTSILL